MVSVRCHLRRCERRRRALLDCALPPGAPARQRLLDDCAAGYAVLWDHALASGAASRNEHLAELSTLALAAFPAAFFLGDLAGRRGVCLDVATPEARAAGQRARAAALEQSNRHYAEYVDLCVRHELITEEDAERRAVFNPADRAGRIEAHRRQAELVKVVERCDAKVAAGRARRRRLRQLEHEDLDSDGEGPAARQRGGGRGGAAGAAGSSSGDDSSDDSEGEGDDAAEADADDAVDEELRERHTAFAEWALLEALAAVQMNRRELEMLVGLTDAEREAAAAEYQREMAAPRERALRSLHVPAASAADVSSVYVDARQAGRAVVQGPPLQQPAAGANYSIMGCGHAVPLKEQVRQSAFQQRNAPTQTLEEFAAQEMAFVAEQQRLEAEGKRRAAEEDARLGEEGVEERQRQKDGGWDNWKDDNPTNGLSAKGNYS